MMSVLMLASAVSCDKDNVVPEGPEGVQPQTPPEEQQPVPEPEPAPDVALSFNISLPQDVSANSNDYDFLDEIHYALYSSEEDNIAYVYSDEAKPVVSDVVQFTSAGTTLEIGLAAGTEGEFVLILWAQAAREDDQEFYDLSDLRHICVTEEPVLCNKEERAAYYLAHKFSVTTETYAEDVTLSRPHARINLGTFAESLKRPDGSTLRLDQSSMTLTGVSTEFNTVEGRAGESRELSFTLNDIPDRAIEINGVSYPYLALNYLFVSDSVDMDFVIMGTPQKAEETVEDSSEEQSKFEGRITGINAQQNLTTNIIGHFFGADGRFEYDFRINIGGDGNVNDTLIIGDADGDGLYDEEMDWGWALGGDDTPSGGGIIGGGDEFVDPDPGFDDGFEDGDEEQAEDVRIEEAGAVTWEVHTREGLLMWADEVRASATDQRINLRLFADVHLEEPWTPVSVSHKTNYYGSIDGQGHSIYNLTINSETTNVGFLAKTCQADNVQVANLYFHNVNIVGGNCTGVVAGTGQGIYNCHVMSGTVSGIEMVGGIVGCSLGSKDYAIRNCTNSADISGTTMVGGIAGEENLSINCYVYDSTNYGNVTATGNYAGGICGSNSSLFAVRCENYGVVRGNDYVGGINSRESVSDCNNSGAVYGNDYVGGITGCCSTSGCVNRGDVTGVNYVGGLSGYCDGNFVNNSENHGAVKGDQYVGGCMGFAKTQYGPEISAMKNYGFVSGKTDVGGIVGYLRETGSGVPTVLQCISDADVTGEENVGGLIGRTKGTFTISGNSVSAIVTGVTNVALLIGNPEGTVTDDGTNVTEGEVVILSE